MNAIVNPNEDTEFHDALRKHGIIPPKAPSRSPSPELPTASERRQTTLQNASLADIDRLLDSEGDRRTGAAGDEEERLLLSLRRQRMEALARERKLGRFGRVYPISRPDYTREVTEASKVDLEADAESDGEDEEEDDGRAETGAGTIGGSADGAAKTKKERKGTGVVCFLYKDSIEECRLLAGYLDQLAAKHPATKFVSIVGDQCIPNYPDRNLPTLLVYRNGELHRQIIGLRSEIGLDGMKTKCADIELLLTAIGVIDPSTVPGSTSQLDSDLDEKSKSDAQRQDRDEVEDEDEGFGGNNRKYQRPSVRSQEDEDADLDWDL